MKRHSVFVVPLCSTLFLFGAGSACARDLVVGADQELVITQAQTSMALERLVLGDRASIRFAEGVSFWDLSARSASIGDGVRIMAAGAEGREGSPGAAPPPAETCQDGAPGQRGSDGGDGRNGVNIALQLVVADLGSLIIDTGGGAGAAGGGGGDGQPAGAANGCEPPRGGEGGTGGRGGRGGDGGNVSLRLGLDNNAGTGLPALLERIEFRVAGGAGGAGGAAGKGGSGSEGHYVKRKTLSGNQAWQPGGAAGRDGATGEPGRPGVDGRVMVSHWLLQEAGSPTAVTVPAAKAGAPDYREEIDQLKAQLLQLQKRVEALEQ